MKAEFEPWWMFDDWEASIISRQSFANIVESNMYLKELLDNLRKVHPNEAMKKDCFFAFWSTNEKEFCEACDENLQIYHGVILMKEGEPLKL